MTNPTQAQNDYESALACLQEHWKGDYPEYANDARLAATLASVAKDVETYFAEYEASLTRWLNEEIEEATSDLRQHFVTEAERRMKAQNELDEAREAAQWLFDKLDDGEWIAEALNKWTWLDLRDTSTGP